MQFFKKPRTIRRYSEPKNVKGYISIPYTEITLPMDIQTLENVDITTQDGTTSVQKLKAFCDEPILTESANNQQKADRVWFQGKWFDCTSCRLSENTPLKHYTATFIECLNQENPPVNAMEGGGTNEPGRSEG